MPNKNPALSTLASNIKQGIDSRLKDLHTSMPGIVVTFDHINQLASVQPAVKRIFVSSDGDKEVLTPSDLPILINVPVIFPRGGGFSLTFPVTEGDECLLVFCERSIDNWHETGKIKVPGARRFHSLSDATAFVGLSSLPNKIPDYDPVNVQLKKDDHSVYITVENDGGLDVHANNDITINSNSDVTLTCVNLEATVSGSTELTSPTIKLPGATTVDGTLTVTGVTSAPTINASTSLTVGGKEMNNHTHTGSPSAPTGPQTNTGTPV
jgi:hypothetical protein